MAKVFIQPEHQITRISKIEKRAKEIQSLAFETLTKRPKEESWSSIEVVQHMSLGHRDYIEKIDNALKQIPDVDSPMDKIKAKAMASFLIKRFPPKEEKIRFKMKTMKQFKPVFDVKKIDQQKLGEVFEEFYQSLQHLLKSIEAYRTKDPTAVRFNSAVGASVKFNVAEAIEFIICHNERHMQQIENTLKKVS